MLTLEACPPILSRAKYDALGRVSRKTFSSGQYEVFAYDSRDRLISVFLRNSGGSPQRTQVYGYDASSKVTSHAVNGATTLYTYDAAGQLLTEIRTGYSGSYSYDGNGNRLTRTVGGVTETYTYDDGDKLLSVSVGGSAIKTYGYDAAGRTTSVVSSAGTTTLAYDFEGRATSISGPGVSQSNVYNGLDTRVGSTTNSVARTFLRDGAYVTDPVLTDGAATYTPGVSERRGSATTYLHNGLKNADAQSGTGQTVVASRQYDAFGNVASSTGTWSGPFGYAGGFGYQEDATGLKLLGHRYYDSSTGRFLTRDPIKDGTNWYAYCENDPISLIDPEGLSPMGPPPIPIPHNTDPNNRWVWSGDPKNGRAGKWVPATPVKVPGGNGAQPHASWDGEGHWDVDDGKGNRNRYTKTGKPISPKYAHGQGKAHYQKGWGKNLGKKVGGAVLRKVPFIGWGVIAYDLFTGGPEHALREATWPLSEAVPK